MKLGWFYTIAKPLVRLFYRVVFFASCYGSENVPVDCGLVVAGNHKSNFDPPFIAAFLPRKLRFLSKASLFRNKFAEWFLLNIGAVPVNSGASETGILKMFISLLKDKNAALIFPEGTRRPIPIEEVKSGAVLFAIKSQTPILPVAIVGKYKLFRQMKIVFGKPKYYDEYYGQKLNQEMLHQLSVELMREVYHMAGEDR